eukprot:79790_1
MESLKKLASQYKPQTTKQWIVTSCVGLAISTTVLITTLCIRAKRISKKQIKPLPSTNELSKINGTYFTRPSDGKKMEYFSLNSGTAKKAIIIFHGSMGTGYLWSHWRKNKILPILQKNDIQLITPSMPGHGASEPMRLKDPKKLLNNMCNDMISLLNKEIPNAKGNLTKYLWNENNGNFISFYCANGIYSKNTLQGDTLYGLLWGFILDIDIEMDNTFKNMFTSHLQTEHEWNYLPYSEYGVIFNVNMSNFSYHCAYGSSNSGKFTDKDKWDDFTLNSGSLYIHLLNDTNSALSYFKTILTKYADLYHDQWDYRILSHYYGQTNNTNNDTNKPLFGTDLMGSDMAGSPYILSNSDYNLCWLMCNDTIGCAAWTYQPPNTTTGCNGYLNISPQCFLKSAVPKQSSNKCLTSGIEPNNNEVLAPSRPACTSHYDRQLIGYSLILALNQQKYDKRNNFYRLKMAPLISFKNKNDCVPLLITGSSSLICVDTEDKCYKIHVLFGKLRLDELIIYERKVQWNNKESLLLTESQYDVVCY